MIMPRLGSADAGEDKRPDERWACDRDDYKTHSITLTICIGALLSRASRPTTYCLIVKPARPSDYSRTTSTTRRQVTAMAATDQMDIYDSMTMQSDSETYDQPEMSSPSSPSSDSASPLILYSPPTFWGLVRGAAINLLLPFVNGLMLGFGELFANELAFRFGWSNTKVRLIASISKETETDSGAGLPQPQTSRTRRRDASRPSREEKAQWSGAGRLHKLGIRRGIKRYTYGICGYMPEACMAAWRGVGVGWSFSLLVTFLSRLTIHISEAIAKKHANLSKRYHVCPLA